MTPAMTVRGLPRIEKSGRCPMVQLTTVSSSLGFVEKHPDIVERFLRHPDSTIGYRLDGEAPSMRENSLLIRVE